MNTLTERLPRGWLGVACLVLAGLLTSPLAAQSPLTLQAAEDRNLQNWLAGQRLRNVPLGVEGQLLSLYYQPEQPMPGITPAALDDMDALQLQLLVEQCHRHRQLPYCTRMTLEQALLGRDIDNSIAYLYLTAGYLESDEGITALPYLLGANGATRTDTYYVDKLQSLRAFLGSVGIAAERINFVAELLASRTMPWFLVSIGDSCVAQSRQSERWAMACLALGEQLESAPSFYANVTGAALKRDVTVAMDAAADQIAASRRNRERYDNIRGLARAHLPWWGDPGSRPDSFYDDMARVGELEALRLAIERAR